MGVSSPELGAFVKSLRVAAGDPPNLTIARHLGYTKNTIYEVYRGSNGNWPTIRKVVQYLSSNPADLAKARRMWMAANTDREVRSAAPSSPKWAMDLASQLDDIHAVLLRIERAIGSSDQDSSTTRKRPWHEK